MKGIRTYLLTILALASLQDAWPQKLKIGLLYDYRVSSLVFSSLNGQYLVIGDSSYSTEPDTNDFYQLSLQDGKLVVRNMMGELGRFDQVLFRGISPLNSYRLKAGNLRIPARAYSGDLEVRIENGFLRLVNHTDLEQYVAGVAAAEGGAGATEEYYKTQAILCRTYALNHLHRHAGEGFHLCDGVHCQAYKGKVLENVLIWQATWETRGLVVVDQENQLITAAFHSNSGGQTANSQDVWTLAVPYLKSVNDPYSRGQNNYSWSKSFSLDEWLRYLNRKGVTISASEASPGIINFEQNARATHYRVKGIDIPLKDMRADLRLKSTFFSVSLQGQNVVLRGKGFGHGVGMSQEGAMNMARQGKNYDEIIRFYYPDIQITDMEKLTIEEIDALEHTEAAIKEEEPPEKREDIFD